MWQSRQAAYCLSNKIARKLYCAGSSEPQSATSAVASRCVLCLTACHAETSRAMKILVTGGAGFIGSAVCRLFVAELGVTVLNVDKLTYAANLASLQPIENHPGY